jgi:surface polysaccharide O-acyltransferase-like enzyme
MEKDKTVTPAPSYCGIDLLRCLAILFVISGHFFLHTPFSETIFSGASMFIQAMFKFFFGMGVPLFILQTGYLNINKSANYKWGGGGVFRVLFSYLLFSVIAVVFRKYYLYESLSWFAWIKKILDFSAIPYGWYIEMWIGLFFLTPFLNILYRNIPSRRLKLTLIAVLCLMTGLPDDLNRYGLYLVPGFWRDCFPLTFFFIGSYIREYQPRINWKAAAGIILAICLINPVFNLLFVHNHTMIHLSGNPQRGLLGITTATLFFILLYRIDFKSALLKSALALVAVVSLDMYLCSYLFDTTFYPVFMERYFVSQPQFGVYFFVMVPLLFACSFALSWLKRQLIRNKYLR